MAKVSLPGGLQKYFNGKTEVEIDGASVLAIIRSLEEEYPGAREKVVGQEGRLCRYIRIFVDGTDITDLSYLETPTDKNSRVKILMALAGG